jgi:hypothetical protein
VQAGFDGLGGDSYFYAIGDQSGALCWRVLMVWVEIAIFPPLGAYLATVQAGFDGLGEDSYFSAIRGLIWGTVQAGFDGSGGDSYFSAIGGRSGALCRRVLMVWVEIVIFLPSGADLGHCAGGF